MTDIEAILQRIDKVLKDNRNIELLYIVLTVILFLCGITCFIIAITTGNLVWSTPSAVTTGFLYFPLQEIKDLRKKNIALATAPILITQLPKAKAAEEIQKLLQNLYGEKK
ncbi:MAG: hypothetical protein ACKVOW_07485 [Chitinophagaceae bacterium]